MADRSQARREATRASDDERKETLEAISGYVADASANEIDRLVYERVRLGILSALAVTSSMSFTELRDLLGVTDGNLSVHARKLEDAGFVRCRKSFEGRLPRTEFALTPRGRRALNRTLDHMEALVRATRRRA